MELVVGAALRRMRQVRGGGRAQRDHAAPGKAPPPPTALTSAGASATAASSDSTCCACWAAESGRSSSARMWPARRVSALATAAGCNSSASATTAAQAGGGRQGAGRGVAPGCGPGWRRQQRRRLHARATGASRSVLTAEAAWLSSSCFVCLAKRRSAVAASARQKPPSTARVGGSFSFARWASCCATDVASCRSGRSDMAGKRGKAPTGLKTGKGKKGSTREKRGFNWEPNVRPPAP